MKEFCVLIDNGHGYETPGKCSPSYFKRRIYEWEYTRKIAKALSDKLTQNGIRNILITPETSDITLSERARRVNEYCKTYNCIMISIHCNASKIDNTGTGFEVWTTKKQTNSDDLADLFVETFKEIMPGYLCRGHREYNWTILWLSNCPCVLTENFFMNNFKDVDFLLSDNGFNKIVMMHYRTIQKYIKNNGIKILKDPTWHKHVTRL